MKSGKLEYNLEGETIKLFFDLKRPVELAICLALLQALRVKGYKARDNLICIQIKLSKATEAALKGVRPDEGGSKQVQKTSRQVKAPPGRHKTKRPRFPSI